MIFSTFNQLNCVLIFLFFGILISFISLILEIIFLRKYQKNFIKIIFDSIFYTFFGIFFIILLFFFNFGKFSITLILTYCLSIFISKHSCLNLVEKLSNKWYNFLKSKFKRKLKHEKVKVRN